ADTARAVDGASLNRILMGTLVLAGYFAWLRLSITSEVGHSSDNHILRHLWRFARMAALGHRKYLAVGDRARRAQRHRWILLCRRGCQPDDRHRAGHDSRLDRLDFAAAGHRSPGR